MKNLPDKIYLNLGDLTEEEYKELDFHDLSDVTWSEDDVQGRNVEYVRKDAFIEKALEWIRENIRPYYHDVRYKYEHFKKYMEENSNEG